jgi:hypothetical protein
MLPWIKVRSFASPARVRASGAQPEMADWGPLDPLDPEHEFDTEYWYRVDQKLMWQIFLTKVMTHDDGQENTPPPAFPGPLDEGLLKLYKMLILKTSPWVIPRRSHFRSCCDLPRFSQFELDGGHLRRSASDGCLEVRRSAKLWHLVDVDSPMVVPTDYCRVKNQQGLMQMIRMNLPAAYEHMLSRGQVDIDRLPLMGEQLRSFMHMTNKTAEYIGIPWNISILPWRYGCYCDIDVRRGGAALSQEDPRADLPTVGAHVPQRRGPLARYYMDRAYREAYGR